MISACLVTLLLAQGDVWPVVRESDAGSPGPSRTAPAGSAMPEGSRPLPVHVFADEDLEVDVLRSLGHHAGVTVWLTTRGTALRESTLDTLARAQRAYVQVRPPFTAALRSQLARVPNAGLWVDFGNVAQVGAVLGNRPLAVSVHGALDSAAMARLTAAKPRVVLWSPEALPDLLALSLARQLTGKMWLAWPRNMPVPAVCPPQLGVALRVELSSAEKLEPSCAKQSIFTVTPFMSAVELETLAQMAPAAQVVFEVGADADRGHSVLRRLDAAGWK